MTSLTEAPASVSRYVRSTSVKGTSRTWWWTGVHWAAMGLLKNAARNGFRGCIHSARGTVGSGLCAPGDGADEGRRGWPRSSQGQAEAQEQQEGATEARRRDRVKVLSWRSEDLKVLAERLTVDFVTRRWVEAARAVMYGSVGEGVSRL